MTNWNERIYCQMKLSFFWLLSLVIVLLFCLSGCAAKAFRDGNMALQGGDYDEAVADFQHAAEKRPEKHEYRMYLQRAKIQTALFHLHQGRQFRVEGDLDRALQEFQLALIFDPSLEAAVQESLAIQKAQQGDKAYKQAEVLFRNGEFDKARSLLLKLLEADPGNLQAKTLTEKLDERLTISGHRLKHLFNSSKPVSLEFKQTDIREVFEIFSQLAGINFVLDEDIPMEMIDLELKDSSLLQGLELLLNIYKLHAKPLNDKSVLIYPNSTDKTRQYDDYKIKTYYLSHISAKHAVNLLRTMLKINNLFVHEERNALVFRERPEVIQLAEQILDANDRADSEVLFELELIEVSHSDNWKFGPSLNPNSVSLGLAKGGNIVASGLSAGDATTNLVQSFSSLESVYTLPTVVFDLQKTLVDSEILATPRIRVKNREKANVHVGNREPVITVTTTGETSTDNIQYVDVGVKLDIEPKIQLDDTVVTNLSLEVSGVTEKNTTANGSLALSISTTKAQTTLTLKNGERTVIGGLIRDDSTKTRKIIPLLGDLPLIGRLFTNHNKDKKKREILLSITPHILQNVDLPDRTLTDIWSGSEEELKTAANFASFQIPVEPVAEESSGQTMVRELNNPLDEPSGNGAEQTLTQEESIVEPPSPAVSTTGQMRFLLTAPPTIAVGETFEVLIDITDASDLYSASMNLSCNDNQMEVMEIIQGGFFEKEAHFSSRRDPENRGYVIDFRLPESQVGASGDRNLAKLFCKAINTGDVLLRVAGQNLRDSQGRMIAIPAQEIIINIE
ncbi:tetratricopeptide repeat protein [Syntrophotalea carbinolica]|nr:secretin N-terminal domain-containing protein [Syntrophotalea carbinolica]